MNKIYGAERAGREPIQQYHPPRKVPQGIARRAPDATALPIPEQTANVAYAPSMPLAGDGDDIVTSATYTPRSFLEDSRCLSEIREMQLQHVNLKFTTIA